MARGSPRSIRANDSFRGVAKDDLNVAKGRRSVIAIERSVVALDSAVANSTLERMAPTLSNADIIIDGFSSAYNAQGRKMS